jgi:hypothetical protein
MPDEFGRSKFDDPDDWEDFMLGMFDIVEQARDLKADEDAIDLIERGRLKLISEFERKFPGRGQGRAVWR